METKENTEDLDDVLSKFKLAGPYYLKFFVLIILSSMASELYCYSYILGAPGVDYRCQYTECEENGVFINSLKNYTADVKCFTYKQINDSTTICSIDNLNQSSAIACTKWIYENPKTFVGEFGLGCQDWKRTLIGTTRSIGSMLGVVVLGPLSDTIGRKKTIALTGIVAGVLGVAKSCAYSYWLFIALELLEAIFGDTGMATYTYAIEMATKDNRVLVNAIIQVTYGLSDILQAAIAWLIPYWRHYFRVLYIPAIIFLLYFVFLDESIRWLLSTGRKQEAIKILKKAAGTDKIFINDDVLNGLPCDTKTSDINLIMLIKTTFASKTLLRRFFGCVFMWATCSFTTETFMINSVSLQGNLYLNYGLTGAMYVLPSLMLVYILKKFNRKKPIVLTFILTGILSMTHTLIPKEYIRTSLAVYLLGTFVSSFMYPIVFLYTSEIFPTYTRNTMHALCSGIGRFGSMLAPQTPLLIEIWPGLPALIMGGLCLIAGFISMMMPDTADVSLPDNVDQAKYVGAKEHKSNQKDVVTCNGNQI